MFLKIFGFCNSKGLFLIPALCFLFLTASCTKSNILFQTDQSDTSVAMMPEEIDHESSLQAKLQNAVAHIHQSGLSSGKVILDEEGNIFGRIFYRCHDKKFRYKIDGETFHIITAVYYNLDGLYLSERISSKEEKYIQKGFELVAILFSFMDVEYIEITSDLNAIAYDGRFVKFDVMERKDDCLINSGFIEIAEDGTLIRFGSTFNRLDDFNDSYKFSKEEIREIAFKELMEVKNIVEASNGFSPGEEYEIIGLPKMIDHDNHPDNFDSDCDDYNSEEALPPFEMHLKNECDITFLRLEKEKIFDDILWMVEAQVKTSLGKTDDAFDYIWAFSIDSDTGRRVGNIEAIAVWEHGTR